MASSSRRYTVGIDIGSSSLKAVAADDDGRVLASARVPLRLAMSGPLEMAHDPRRAWRLGPRRVLWRLTRLVEGRLAGACVAAIAPSIAAVDRRGRPLGAGLLYGDARGNASAGSAATWRASQKAASPGSRPFGAAMELLTCATREVPNAAGYWPAQAVANEALAGAGGVVDLSSAFAMSPLFDGERWDPALVEAAGATPDRLPRVAGLGEVVGEVGGAPLASGIVDILAEQLVSGADEPGDVLVVCGTTLVTWVVTSRWTEVPGLWTVPHTVPGLFLVGGPSNAGGLFLDWATGLTGPARREADPSRVPVWAPYPRGERSPLHDPSRRAVLAGLEIGHDRAAVRRAAFEAVGYVVRQHVELTGLTPRRVVATGGGTRRPELLQALADTTGLPVDVAAVAEGGALGAAFLARVAAGLEPGLEAGGRWARWSVRVEPRAAWVGPTTRRYETFRQLAGAGALSRGEETSGLPT